MLVAGEGPPDERAGAPTSSKVIQILLTTGNAELRTTPPRLFILLSSTQLQFFWVIYEYH